MRRVFFCTYFMEQTQFIFVIETEHHLNMVSRITSIFSRQRITQDSVQVTLHEGVQQFIFLVTDTRENACKIQKVIEKQIEVLKVTLFENVNPN
ncbi:MAG: hypothetical protein KGM98_10190 [Bacteroidota bacterium]|nr:hypothetical protein [Bacteroidota bacterium]